MSKLLIEDREKAIDYILGGISIKFTKEEVMFFFNESSNLPISKRDISIISSQRKLREIIYYITTMSVESVVSNYPTNQKRIKKEILYEDIKTCMMKNLCN
jgi:hypothetical protein